MPEKKQFLTVYSYRKTTVFDEFTGHMDILYTTYIINNGMPMKESGGVINRSKCKNFKEYIIDFYNEYAIAHTVEKLG